MVGITHSDRSNAVSFRASNRLMALGTPRPSWLHAANLRRQAATVMGKTRIVEQTSDDLSWSCANFGTKETPFGAAGEYVMYVRAPGNLLAIARSVPPGALTWQFPLESPCWSSAGRNSHREASEPPSCMSLAPSLARLPRVPGRSYPCGHLPAEPACHSLAVYSRNEVAFMFRHATALNNLAELFRTTIRLSEAEPLMRRALAIHQKSFGRAHADHDRCREPGGRCQPGPNREADG
jgi:Tetratricopeptide repeat